MIDPPLSDADKAKLLGLLAKHELSDTEPYAASNALNKPQPTTVQRPKPFDMEDLLKVVSAENADKIMNVHFIDSFITAVASRVPESVMTYVKVFASRALITSDEFVAVKGVLEATEDHIVDGDSWFKAEFPGYSYAVETQTTHASSAGGLVLDEEGKPAIFTDRQHCTSCTAALIEEARS